MCSKFQTGPGRTGHGHIVKNIATVSLAGFALIAVSGSQVLAQEVDTFRPGLDVAGGAEVASNALANNDFPGASQQNNNPQPPGLLSNQPEILPPPPLPPRRQRLADPFAPVGLRLGSFNLFPVLEVTGVTTDNVNSDNRGEVSDVGVRIAPSLRLQSDWARHSFNLDVASENVFYKTVSENDSIAFNASSSLRLDIRRNTNLATTASYRLSEARSGSSEVPGGAIGDRRDHDVSVTSALAHRFNRASATITAGLNWVFVDDLELQGGITENNADREYIEPSLRFRLGYEISPAIIPFAEVGYSPRFHRQARDRNGNNRDSQGVTTSAGLGFNLSSVWDGEIALVFEHRNFEDSELSNINAVGVNANVNWRPSQLTTVTFTSSAGVDESTRVGVSGARNYDLALNFSHRFRENFTGTFGLGFNYDDFVGSSDDDMYFTVQAGFAYAIMRELEWVANYQLVYFESGTLGGSYSENRISTGFRFRL